MFQSHQNYDSFNTPQSKKSKSSMPKRNQKKYKVYYSAYARPLGDHLFVGVLMNLLFKKQVNL